MKYLRLLLLPLLLLTAACSFLPQAQGVAEQVEQVSKPRLYVTTLAKALLEVKNGLSAEFEAGRMQRADFLAQEPAVLRATAALDAAGKHLAEAATTEELARTAVDNLKKLAYAGQAKVFEGLALKQAEAAEADIAALRAAYNRVRGLPAS